MVLNSNSPFKSLNKAYLKEKLSRNNVELFKAQLSLLFSKADAGASEDTLKDFVIEFMRNTWYNPNHVITVNKERKDFSVHTGKNVKDPVGVIAEIKKMNSGEMMTAAKPNVKAFHELVLYYLQERISQNNNEVKYLLATDINNWILIDANEFDKKIFRNVKIKKLYEVYVNDKKDNPFFYGELKRILDEIDETFECTHFNLSDYKKFVTNADKEDDNKLLALYKILSPVHLLKLPFANDSNSLDKNFYTELLHIIGLKEVKDGGKKLIQRKKISSEASLLENAVIKLQDKDCLRDVPDVSRFGLTNDEQYYNIALELCITWINRILFLKLLEAQLYTYHQNDKAYLFLSDAFIADFDELNNLFLQVLAEKPGSRRARLKEKFRNVPYLNSSLFERTDLERKTIDISALDNNLPLPLLATTVLKDGQSKRRTGSIPTLSYLFHFLDSYDFTSEGKAEIQEENKTLINASVLGLIFEKINGYKDGSFFTPGFITMYMCRETLRRAVVQKFNEKYADQNPTSSKESTAAHFTDFDDLKEKIEYNDRIQRQEANNIINSITICDPAVGSGHFLVSALNELIAIKHDLKVLQYRGGSRVREYSVEVVNDELIIQDTDTEDLFEYTLSKKGSGKAELQALQETLFHEKETLIENCLFGVDINANSVKICRLRLWIELLKNAYYTKESNYTELETLPNIDINIKQGNSLISRFAMDADLAPTLAKSKWTIDGYKAAVQTYRSAQSKEEKREMEVLIDTIKKDFKTDVATYDPINKKLSKLRGELAQLQTPDLFSGDAKKKKTANTALEKITKQIAAAEKEKDETKNNAIYKDAFEWRFEFPEVLDGEGMYLGFDVVIGNPPYLQLQKLNFNSKTALEQQMYNTFSKTGDIYQLFYEKGFTILKQNGDLGFITSNKWMRTDYGISTREFLSTRCHTRLIIDFGMALLFDSATILTNILFLIKTASKGSLAMCRVKEDFSSGILLDDYVDFASIEMANPGKKSWISYNKHEFELIQKIIAQGTPLSKWDIQINRGILTGFNEAFIINTETKNRLIAEDPKSEEIIKPILRGEDIKSYLPEWGGKWLINAHNGLKSSGIPRVNVKDDYPAVYKWLLQFENALSKRFDKGNHWSNLRNCAYLEEFYKPKIIYPNMTKFMPFVYDNHQFFSNDKTFILTGSNLYYLAVVLNSKLFKFTFKECFPELLGETREIRKVFFETIPIKLVGREDWWKEKLLEITSKKLEGYPIQSLQIAIDEMVFDAYNLTCAERKIILSSFDPDRLSEEHINSSSLLETE